MLNISPRMIERLWPYTISILGGSIWYFSKLSFPVDGTKELLSALLTAASIVAGFMITAISILLPIIGSTKIGERIIKRGLYDDLMNYMKSTIKSSLMLAVGSVIGLIITKNNCIDNQMVTTTIITISILCAATFYRATQIIFRIFELASKPVDQNW